MNTKLLTAAMVLSVAIGSAVLPAQARHMNFAGLNNFSNGGGWHQPWGQNMSGMQSACGGGGGWRGMMGHHRDHRWGGNGMNNMGYGNGMNTMGYGNGLNTMGYGNGLNTVGYGNGLNAYGYGNGLNTYGNGLTGYGNGLGNVFQGLTGGNSRLLREQQKLTQDLSNGNLSPSKAAFLQNELNRVNNRLGQVQNQGVLVGSAANPYATSGVWGSLRNMLH